MFTPLNQKVSRVPNKRMLMTGTVGTGTVGTGMLAGIAKLLCLAQY